MNMKSNCCSASALIGDICSACKEHAEFYDEDILQTEDLIVDQKYKVIAPLSISGHDGDAEVIFPTGYILTYKGQEADRFRFETADGITIEVWDDYWGTQIPQLQELTAYIKG